LVGVCCLFCNDLNLILEANSYSYGIPLLLLWLILVAKNYAQALLTVVHSSQLVYKLQRINPMDTTVWQFILWGRWYMSKVSAAICLTFGVTCWSGFMPSLLQELVTCDSIGLEGRVCLLQFIFSLFSLLHKKFENNCNSNSNWKKFQCWVWGRMLRV
jgi:hypothetical protein